MAQRCECVCCGHPVLKKVVEFYCIIWGLLGVIFLIMMLWGMVQYGSFIGKGGWQIMGGPGMMQQQETPGYNWR